MVLICKNLISLHQVWAKLTQRFVNFIIVFSPFRYFFMLEKGVVLYLTRWAKKRQSFVLRLFWVFRPTGEFFTYMETSPLLVKGCKFWPMLGTYGHWAVRVLLACHTYCDTGHPFIMVISEEPWHSHLLPSVWQLGCHYLFLRFKPVATAIRTPNIPLAGELSNRLCHLRGRDSRP